MAINDDTGKLEGFVKTAEHARGTAHVREVDLTDVMGALKRQKGIVILAPLALMLVAGLYAAVTRPAYTGVAQVYVDPRERHAPKDDPLQNAVPGDGLLLVESQLKIITSDEVLTRVVEKERLDQDGEFNGRGAGVIDSFLARMGLKSPVDPKLAALRTLRRKVSAKRIDRSFVIDIMASADTAARAVAITNALATSYLEEQAGGEARFSKRLSESVGAQLEKLRTAVTQSENAVAAFKAENNLVGSRNGFVSEQQLDEANTQLTNAKTRLAEAQAHVRLVDSIRRGTAGLEALPEAIQSATMVQLRARAVDLAREEAQLATTDGPKHPALLAVQAQRRELQAAIRTEVQRIAQAVHNTAANEGANVQYLQSSFDALKAEAQANDKLLVPLRQLERTAEANREIYANFLAKAKTAEQQQVIDKTNIRLITTATTPEAKSWPPTALMLAVALPVGLFFGIAIALLRDYLTSKKQRSPKLEATPVERETDLKTVIDNIGRAPRGHTALFLWIAPDQNFVGIPLEIARDVGQKTGAEVLFIDADMTGGRATRLLRLETASGLGDVLYGDAPFEEAAYFHKRLGLTCMPSGRLARSEPDAATREAVDYVLELARRFDLVVIDAGPLDSFPIELGLHEFVDELIFLAPSTAAPESTALAVATFGNQTAGVRIVVLDENQKAAA